MGKVGKARLREVDGASMRAASQESTGVDVALSAACGVARTFCRTFGGAISRALSRDAPEPQVL